MHCRTASTQNSPLCLINRQRLSDRFWTGLGNAVTSRGIDRSGRQNAALRAPLDRVPMAGVEVNNSKLNLHNCKFHSLGWIGPLKSVLIAAAETSPLFSVSGPKPTRIGRTSKVKDKGNIARRWRCKINKEFLEARRTERNPREEPSMDGDPSHPMEDLDDRHFSEELIVNFAVSIAGLLVALGTRLSYQVSQ